MKPRIRYELKAYGRTVVFYVHEMDERFRASGVAENEYVNHFCRVRSVGYPNMVVGRHMPQGSMFVNLSLFGCDSNSDDEVSTFACGSEREAEQAIDIGHKILEDWANNWEGWGDNKEPEIEFVKSDGMYGCYSCRIAGSCDKNIKLMCNYSKNGYYVVKIGKKRTLTEENGVFTI